MRAGKLDRTIQIDRFESGVNEWNEPVEGWVPLGTYRAEIVQESTEEFFRAGSQLEQQAIVFRTRFFSNISTSARVVYQGQAYGILEVREIGRRQGLELRCAASVEA